MLIFVESEQLEIFFDFYVFAHLSAPQYKILNIFFFVKLEVIVIKEMKLESLKTTINLNAIFLKTA